MSNQQKESLKDKMVEHIYDAILNGEFKQGSQIKEAHLATKLNVSRAPIREALLELVSLGILEQIARRGVFVKEITTKDIADTYEAKGVIEGFLAANFTLHATHDDIELLDSYIMQMSDTQNSTKKVVKIGEKFHHHYLKYAKNSVFLEALKRINKKSQILFYKNWTKLYTLEEVKDRHQKIAEAIKTRNVKIVEDSIREHYFETGTKIILLKREE